MRFSRVGFLSGILTPIWLVVGVTVAGAIYPGYSHFNQALSELGAAGAPTHFISPIINNYPLGVLFSLFGAGIIREFPLSALARFTGTLVVLQGWLVFLPGIFPAMLVVTPRPLLHLR